MFIAMLRVEIVADVIWSRELMLASWPKTRSPPTCGHLKGAACTAPVQRGCRDPSTQKRCTAARRRRRGWAGLGSVNGATRLELESMGACAVSVLSAQSG